MALFGWLENQVIQLLSPFLGPLRPLIAIVTKFKDNTTGLLSSGVTLGNSLVRIYGKLVNFTFQPKIASRVINLPKLQQHAADLAAAPGKIIHSIEDLWSQLKNKVDPAAFDVEELEGLEDLRAIFTKLGSRLAAAFEKVLGWVTLLVDALVTIRSSIDDIQTICDAVEEIIDDIANLEGLFLSQKNPRKTLQLADGGSIKIRVGSLHDS